jgi:hypothetical protein
LGIFLEITAVAKFLACLFHGESCALILAKNWLDQTLGDFSSNASGHPVNMGD